MRFAWMCDFARDLERENAALKEHRKILVKALHTRSPSVMASRGSRKPR
jgi:hypothetical protein